MKYYLVMDSWNVCQGRFNTREEAAKCAKAIKGFVVEFKAVRK